MQLCCLLWRLRCHWLMVSWECRHSMNYFLQEIGHLLAAFPKRVKLSIPYFIPSITLGSFGAITQVWFDNHSVHVASSRMPWPLMAGELYRNDVVKKKSFQLMVSSVVFSVLGCLMFGVLVYTILADGSPFRRNILTPNVWLLHLLRIRPLSIGMTCACEPDRALEDGVESFEDSYG